MNTYLKDFYNFIKKQAVQGHVEIRMVATVNPSNGSITVYAHPLNKDGDTFDFMLSEIGEGVEIMSYPSIFKDE